MSPRFQSEEIPALNLTSMIDVLLVLIIFFIVGTKFIEAERQIELKLPQVAGRGALAAAPEKKVSTSITTARSRSITRASTLEELARKLAAARSQYKALGVVVRGDATATYQSVASVLNACKQAGIADLTISVEMADAQKKTCTSLARSCPGPCYSDAQIVRWVVWVGLVVFTDRAVDADAHCAGAIRNRWASASSYH